MTLRDKSGSNPQSRTISRFELFVYGAIAVIAVIGVVDCCYLTITHLTGDDAACGPSSGCSKVLSSAYASFRGIPTAAFGAVGYFTVFSLAILALFDYRSAARLMKLVVTAMFATTLWLLYLQAFVLHAFCPFCLLSAALSFLMAGLSLVASAR